MAIVKIGVGVRKLLEKAGIDAEVVTKVETALANEDAEIDESVLSKLMTETEAEPFIERKIGDKLKVQGRKEVWDFMDKNHTTYEAVLSEEAKVKYNALKNSQEKNKFLLEYLQERGTQSGDSLAYKKSFTDLQEKLKNDYVPKSDYEAISQKLTPAQKRALDAEIIMEATRHAKISDTLKADRRFKTNFIADFQESIVKKGYTVDFETGQLKDKDGASVLGKDNNPLTAVGYIDTVLEEFEDWNKKSDGPPEAGTIVIPSPTVKSISSSASKNLQEALV